MDLALLMDAAVEQNLVPGEYFSLWDDLGGWQLDALRSIGLRPEHRLLDVGCGAMRLGLAAVDYLDDGNYFGVDAFAPYIAVARRLAEATGVKKRFTLQVDGAFAFERFQTQFDYGMAQSVFTHLSEDECGRCVASLRRVMRPGSQFLFTYLIGVPVTQGMLYCGTQPMRRFAGSNPEFFAELAARNDTKFERLSLPHPTGQQVAVFRF
jgi:SAM-dependent methyltransferase